MPSPAKKNKVSAGLVMAGALFILGAVVLIVINFAPVISLELGYFLKHINAPDISKEQETMDFLSDNSDLGDFALYIPKIEAKTLVVANVDPFNANEYNGALTKGVAHAKGTALPGINGNTFLFAHSGRNYYDGIHMNVQFYLLEKLEPFDRIYIKYQGQLYIYEVSALKKVWPDEITYLSDQQFAYNKLTLMSCWPAGINYQRQLVEAKLIEVKPL